MKLKVEKSLLKLLYKVDNKVRLLAYDVEDGENLGQVAKLN